MHHQWILGYDLSRHRAEGRKSGLSAFSGAKQHHATLASAPEIIASKGRAECLAHSDDQIVTGRR